METDDTPGTMRVPHQPDPTLALIDAAMADDLDIDVDYDDFDVEEEREENRPTLRRCVGCRPASPTLPSRIA